ncbi:MAG: hypothetical protein IJX57_00880, partial [Clostridia bacterium]|nr:hypothetical protein [Clostridia bacterium]
MKKNEFKNPSEEYRSIPFWAWNDKMDKDEIKRQIKEMSHCGMGGFFMHSRDGLETEYLGDEWFECIRTAVEEAKKHSMKAWLYDEDRWPSGSCGGKVTKNGKGCKGLTLEVCESVPEEEVLALYAAEICDMEIHSLRRIDTDDKINEDEKVLAVRLETSAPSEWFNFSPPPDNLSDSEVGDFINSTHEEYKKHIGEYFGETVCGIFTDEPSLADRHASFNPKRGWIPWTTDFAEYYNSKRETDVFDTLPYIYFNHKKSAKARLDFWHTISEMFHERYSKKISAWCKENKIAYTGHFLQEDKLGLSCRVSGSIMPHYATQDIPAIDLLTDRTEEYLTVKQCTSVASQLGKDMVLSEMYGCTGWNFDFEGQKRIGEWQYVLGINQRCQHLALYSLRGCRKRDYPPSINCNVPWWSEYRTVEDYFARLGYVLRQGKRVENVLVIHPMSTVWSKIGCNPYGNPVRKEERDVPAMNKLGDKLNEFIKYLCHNHYGCELGDETLIAEHGSVKNGKFIIGQAEYDTVIVPFSETLFATTKKLLSDFEKQGGEIIWGNNEPRKKPLVSITDNNGNETTDILYQLRKTDDGHILYLVNTSKEKSHIANIDFDGKVYKLNPLNGEIYLFDTQNGFKEHFSPCGSSLFYITDAEIEYDKVYTHKELTDGIPLSPVSYNTDTQNILTLDKCYYTLNGEKSDLKEVWLSQCEIRETLEMRQINLNGIEQRYRWIDKPHKNNDKIVTLEFPFTSLCDVKCAELVIERSGEFEIYLDGQKIKNKPIGYFIDKSFERVPLPDFVKGNHVITIECNYRNDFELENIYITGDFGVNPSREIIEKPKTLTFGDITKQGYFHYAGAMEYCFEYDMESEKETYLDVTDFKG